MTQSAAKPASLESLQLARLCARYADDKKAEDIVILDVRGLSPITEFFVICSATSSPHLRAVRDEVADRMKLDHGQAALVNDGGLDSQWLILGYAGAVFHVFAGDKREFYALEELWNDAPRLDWKT